MNEPELIPDQPRWLVRVTETIPVDNGKGIRKSTRTAQLIWGVANLVKGKNDVTREVINGDCHHELTGPTAEKSIRDMAERMNREGKLPPETKQPKTRMDGYRQSFKEAGGDALFPADVLKSTISYKK